MTHFGRAVESRFESIENDMKQLRAQNESMQSNIDSLLAQQEKDKADMSMKVDRVLGEVTEVKKAATSSAASIVASSSSGSAGTSLGGSSKSSGVQYEARTVARIGNLGWNDTPDVIVSRAKSALAQTGISDSTFTGLGPASNRVGSSAELVFNSPSDLQRARMQMKTTAIIVHGEGPVWLDARKSREEIRPSRITHRVHECLVDLLMGQIPANQIEKDMKGKCIKVSGSRAGFCLRGEWVRSQAGYDAIPEEVRQMAKAYGEDD